MQRADIWWRLLHNSSLGYTINVSPYVYRQVIYDPIDLSMEIDFVFLERGSARFSCPLIDPILWQQGCPLLQQLYLGVLCSVFDVQYWVRDCYYQLSELWSPIPPFPVSKRDRMDVSSLLSLPIITCGKGGEGWRKLTAQEACNVHLRWLVKWVVPSEKVLACSLMIE